MATILRSSKYIRCLNGLTQRIVAHENNKFVTKRLVLQVQCTNSYLTKSYATIPATQRAENIGNFDKLFNKLDENVQRYGRIFKPEVDAVLSKVREAGYISNLDALLLIRCCGELLVDTLLEERIKLSQEVWITLDTLKIRLDVSHFNALLRVYLENNYEFSPIEFLTAMRDKGIEPNRVTYQRLMLHYCKKGDIDGATKILEVMRERGLPLNEGVFNALIRGHSEANDMESAKNVMNVMREAGIEPCASTYKTLLCAYAKRTDMESIKQTLAEIESKNLYLQDNDFFDIIHVLATDGNDDKVNEILEMIPKGPNYNMDAVHAILRILDVGNVDVALKILSVMRKRPSNENDMEQNESGTFLIRKLVNSKYPVEKIVNACERMQRDGQHSRPFSIAVERALENGDIECSTKLLMEWMKHDGEIREHYFWPLFATHGKASNYQGIIDTIKLMSTSFEVVPSFETIKDYFLPYAVGQLDDIISTLSELKIPHFVTTSAIAIRMLSDNKIRKTALFMLNYPSPYNAEHFYRPLTEAVRFNSDTKSFASILRCLYESAVNSNKSDELGESLHKENIVDNAMRILLEKISSEKYEVVNKILEHLVEVGLSISPEVGIEVRQYFQDNINPLTDERLEKLTSGTLTPVSIEELKSFISFSELMHVGMSSEDRMVFTAKRRELEVALKSDNLTGANNIIKELESLNYTFSPALCAQIIYIASKFENMEMAEYWVNKAKADPNGISLDFQKVTKYATLLIKNDRFDDAIKFILEIQRQKNPENHGPGLRKLVKGLLNAAAETGNVEKTNELFEVLLKAQYMTIDNYMLGSLIKVHLTRNDLKGALEAFEDACKNHQCTPLKNELSKCFIETEDANSLQKLTDLSTVIHGESNSLVDLVLSFVECGRLRQARKILETPGLRLRGKKLRSMVERYVDEGNTDWLEQFMDITKGLAVIERREFYDIVIEAYSKNNNWQRGLTLWTTIQDEDLQPTDTFLTTLGYLLKRNNQPIPFDFEKSYKSTAEVQGEVQENQDPDQRKVTEFYEALDKGELEKAENFLEGMSSNRLQFRDAASSLIDRYISQKNDLDKACKLIEYMIVNHGQHPRVASLKSVWNGYLKANEFEKLRKHGNVLDMNIKKRLRFHKFLNRAELKECGVTKFLADFESKLTDSKSENFQIVKEGLHFSTLIQEFKIDTKALKKFHQLAERLSEQEIYSPINLVWSYYFEQDHPEAEAVWNKHLSNTSRVMFNYIIQQSKRNNDTELMERLYKKLQTHNHLSTNSRVHALSAVIDLYNVNSRYEDSLKVIESSSPLVVKTWMDNNPIIYAEFKKGLEANGKTFFFKHNEETEAEQ